MDLHNSIHMVPFSIFVWGNFIEEHMDMHG